jgi:AcrR family transcriptional regulator
MRQIKNHQERKSEIIDASESLFYSKGYERCTINDILKEVGIAKGTFYHYFNSKEDVLDAVVDKTITLMLERIHTKITKHSSNTSEKLMNVFLAMRVDDIIDDDKISDIHMPENALLHQKALSTMIESITPILVGIVEEGIEEGVWSCHFPLEYMQIFLASSLILTDDGIFKADQIAKNRIMFALVTVLEKMLAIKESTFVEMFQENWHPSDQQNL